LRKSGSKPCNRKGRASRPAFSIQAALPIFGVPATMKGRTVKSPMDQDFTVKHDESGVHVIFTPTNSHYDFRFLADAAELRSMVGLARM
jgi:hypothetical protein